MGAVNVLSSILFLIIDQILPYMVDNFKCSNRESDSALGIQLFHTLSCVVVHTMSQYILVSREHSTVMVEAWVKHDTHGTDIEKGIRRKTQDKH